MSEDIADPPAPDLRLTGAFVGRRGRVFWMGFRFGVYTILTLGLYRFWMKTRLRRWYWSSVRIGGVPLEYVGDPLEKLLGFLIAVVILAFYIGVVNLLLMFASFSLFQGDYPAYVLSFVGVIPLWFYARYRARRYVLARTRWRGIRLGLAPGAWGYAWRSLWHWALTLLTLGILWPRKAFWLEKFITDRTWYGSLRLEQGGRWHMLLRPFLQVWVSGVALAGLAIWVSLTEQFEAVELTLACALPIWFGCAVVHYRVRSLQRLTEAKRAGGMRFDFAPRTRIVLRIYLVGYGIAGLVAMVFLAPIGVIGLITMQTAGVDLGLPPELTETLSNWGLSVIGIVTYFGLFLIWSALTHAFVTMPLWRHYAQCLALCGAQHLDRVTQRPRDSFGEAEGFAEALDVGAAI